MSLHHSGQKTSTRVKKLLVLIIITLVIILVFALIGEDYLKLKLFKLQQMQSELPKLLSYIQSFRLNTSLVLFGLAVLQGIVPLIPFFLLAGASGVLNGLWFGLLLIWTGATLGAIILFTLTRYLGKEYVQLWLRKRDWDLQYTEEQGFSAILLARLIPVFPSVVINLASGVSKVRFSSFGTATALGKLPWTFLYTSIGYNLSRGHVWATYVSIAFLAILLALGFYRWLNAARRENKIY